MRGILSAPARPRAPAGYRGPGTGYRALVPRNDSDPIEAGAIFEAVASPEFEELLGSSGTPYPVPGPGAPLANAPFMRLLLLILMLLSTVTLAGCELVGDIFQAGMAVGVIGVLLVIALVIWLGSKLMG